MVNTNRIEGLIFLKNHNLPVPDFLKVDSISKLKDPFLNKSTPYGWTMRTCKKNGEDEINLFYKNHLSLRQLRMILLKRLSVYKDEFYIIYPSWNFDFSFNILKTKYEFIIEGVVGSQKNISLGVSNPTFNIVISSINYSINNYQKDIPYKIMRGVFRAVNLLKSSIFIKSYYTEVAITKDKNIYFYEFRNIDKL